MVKGTNHRVIVVRSPDPNLFEEAIFVLKDAANAPQDANLVLEQARRAAGDYLKNCGMTAVKRHRHIRPILLAGIFLLLAGIGVSVWYFFF